MEPTEKEERIDRDKKTDRIKAKKIKRLFVLATEMSPNYVINHVLECLAVYCMKRTAVYLDVKVLFVSMTSTGLAA